MPTIDVRDNLVLLDHWTTRMWRWPKVGEVIMAENPFKPGFNIVKRVKYLEGDLAEFYSYKDEKIVQLVVPKGHIWVEGDNPAQSKDSREFGPIPLALVDGIVRARVWPLDKMNKL